VPESDTAQNKAPDRKRHFKQSLSLRTESRGSGDKMPLAVGVTNSFPAVAYCRNADRVTASNTIPML